MSEEDVVPLIVERHDSTAFEIGVVREEASQHPSNA